MKDARLDHKGAYVCGDTVYPGQGIVGVCLSGIIAFRKLMQDHYQR
jgi:phytoene dehydrogenase-like protein